MCVSVWLLRRQRPPLVCSRLSLKVLSACRLKETARRHVTIREAVRHVRVLGSPSASPCLVLTRRCARSCSTRARCVGCAYFARFLLGFAASLSRFFCLTLYAAHSRGKRSRLHCSVFFEHIAAFVCGGVCAGGRKQTCVFSQGSLLGGVPFSIRARDTSVDVHARTSLARHRLSARSWHIE